VPGLIVIIILAILINPALLSNLPDELKDKNSELAPFLRPTVTQGILYVVVCYLVGFAIDGLIYWLFGQLVKIFQPLKKFHAHYGSFEKALFDCKYRDDSGDFDPYTDKFVKNFKVKIDDVFGIKVETIQKEAEKAKNDVKYIEIFDLCRTAVLKQSPDVYSRGFTLLAQYNSAKLIGSIFFLASVSFWVKIIFSENLFHGIWILFITCLSILMFVSIVKYWVCLSQQSFFSSIYWIIFMILGLIALLTSGFSSLFISYCISAVLCPIFFHLYYIRLKYYRNTILYGFYEYALTSEKSWESENSEN
jgi:hypothetical protein